MEATMEQSVVEREPAKGAVPTFTFHFNARSPLKSFYEVLSAQPSCILAEERTFIEHLASTDQILSSADRQKLLNLLSHALLLPCLTLHVVQHFRPILIELVARWMRPLNDPEERKSFNFTCDCTLTVPTSPKMSSGMCIPSKRDAEGQPLQDEDGNPRVAGFAEVALCAISEFLVSTPQVHPYAIRIVQSLKKEGFLQMISSSHLPSDSFPRLRRVIRAIYRIVSINRISFAKLLSWFALFGFVSHQDAKVQAYAIHTLATILEMSASERDIFLKKHIAEDTKDFELSIIIPAIEEDIDRAARSALLSHSQLDGENSSMLPPILISSDDLSNFSQDVAGVLIPCDRSDRIVSDISQQFVLTPTARENLHNLALAISMNVPIMTTGSAGCGKTALIEQAAALVNQPHLMKIHLGDQTDAKLLLGTYICTSTPGEFIWQDGILTTAVEEGRWILFEDFDSAPVEVISVLRPLLESGWLSIPSRGARIQAKAGFRIFATQQSENRGSSFRQTLGESLWYQIDIKDLPTDEISDILAVNYPELGDAALVPSIMRTFLNLQRLYAQPMFGGGRGASLRDLLKWCRRISHLHLSSGTTETTQRSVSRSEETVSRIGEGMLREAIDCFVGAAYQPEIRQSILNVIGESLDVVPVRLEYLFQQFVPSYSCAGDVVEVGRVQFKRKPLDLLQEVPRIPFALAPNSLRLMEKIAVCIDQHEPILLVGETGTGKTTVVQHLAHLAHTPLTVINMSQQSDSSDLLGGFKPVDIKLLSIPVLEEFDKLFSATFSVKANMAFLSSVKKAVKTSRWKVFVKACRMGIKMAQDMFTKSKVGLVSGGLDSAAQRSAKKSKLRNYSQELESHWQQFASKVTAFEVTQQKSQGSLLFSFIEGALVRAMKEGHWVLLDEINLASPETLDCLTGLLASTSSSVILLERGDHTPVIRHKNFRIFGCMNPANDAGKRNLAPALRTRFTEFWVDAPDANFADLLTIVRQYLVDVLPPGNVGSQICQDVGEFYTEVRRMASEGAVYDGADHTVHYSMRTLARALLFATWSTKKRFWDLRRGLWEGCSMTFTTGLSASSRLEVLGMLKKVLGGRRLQPARQNPDGEGSDHTISVAGYWLPLGPNSAATSDSLSQSYVLTPTVTQNLSHLARAVMSGKYPVLIQGPTSAGKTSMVEYLAKATGHTCVRVNNHEGTDISEYIGGWGENDADGDQKGQLVWQEGILVSAVKNGYWLILDELNLAPSEVLESLNRLLDDNRELFIPETQQVIRPHPNFMLFATQNPAGTTYGGRKQLSRAFRNRFLEIHFNDIPSQELHTILESRCGIAPSYAERIVAVYKALQSNRGRGRVFEGRHGFVTLRDLFRWGSRECIGYQQLAEEGWCLLGERMRTEADRVVVKEVIEKEMKVALNVCEIYENGFRDVQTALESLFSSTPEKSALAAEMVWTPSTKRLFTLVWKCVQNNEPVLLVGDTGAGKTTVCQIIAALCGRDLRILNAHQGSEVSDFIGGNRPVRGREQLLNDAYAMLHQLEKELDLQESDTSSQPFSEIAKVIDQELANRSNVLSSKELKERLSRAVNLYDQSQTLFTWKDGPLTTALREGSHFLLDEISLADDSVLERMNSVLETSQFLLLAEKGRAEALYASPGFRFLATMNPGGDYGKKELSPALRNRFCELWVPGVTDRADLTILIHAKLTKAGLSDKGANDCTKWMMDFYDWLCDRLHKPRNVIITLRDVLSWVDLLAHTHLSINLTLPEAFFHGGCMVIVDGISINPAFGFSGSVVPLQNELRRFLWQLTESALVEPGMHEGITTSEDRFGVHPFYIGTGPHAVAAEQFSFDAPTTLTNLSRVLRALQLPKPVLLEGSPGVGKTSLISTLAKKTGHRLTRINLSDQTDLTDLFGTDLPTEGTGNAGRFSWRDGPFLNAMKRGEWVLLDELNLATQQVLEGLNACLDHRGEVYLPELDRVFKKGAGFRVFAAQNPQAQGGGRKGLPRSFLNRFTNVYIEVLTEADMTLILSTLYPTVDESILAKMVRFNERIKEEAAVKMHFASRGSPWEYNLRDIHRWVELLVHSKSFHPRDFVRMMYTHRMRTLQDRTAVIDIYNEIFEDSLPFSKNPEWHLSPERVVIGCAALDRLSHRSAVGASSSLPIDDLNFLPSRLSIMESLLKCVELKYMPILVGAGGSGKTSLVRLLAGICGATLVEFNLNPAVDSVELLGGFEQVDISRRKKAVVDTLGSVVELIVRSLCTEDVAEDITVAHRLQETWINISGSMTSYSSTQEAEMFVSELEVLCNRKLFVLKHLRPDVFTDIRSLILLYKDAITTGAHGSFEWVDGSLIRAMENGHWILFDNVNLCPAAVLDRLNPLLERAGTLTVSERGLDEKGQVRTIESNGNFRIFMAMNDRYGEISRAMRNRGVELFVGADPEHAQVSNVPDELLSLLSDMGMQESTMLGKIFMEQLQRGASWQDVIYSPAIQVQTKRVEMDHSFLPELSPSGISVRLPPGKLIISYTQLANVMQDAAMLSSVIQSAAPQEFTRDNLLASSVKVFLEGLVSDKDMKIRESWLQYLKQAILQPDDLSGSTTLDMLLTILKSDDLISLLQSRSTNRSNTLLPLRLTLSSQSVLPECTESDKLEIRKDSTGILIALTRILCTQYLEMQVMQKTSDTVLHRSKAYAAGRLGESDLDHPCVAFIWELLQKLIEFSKFWLVGNAEDSQTIDLVMHLLEQRDSLWTVAHSSVLRLDELRVVSRRIYKTASFCIARMTVSDTGRELSEVVTQILNAIGITDRLDSVLWGTRNGSILNNRDLVHLEGEMLTCDQRLDVWKVANFNALQSPGLITDIKVRRELMDGISTLYYIGNSANLEVGLIDLLQKLPDALNKVINLTEYKMAGSLAEENEECRNAMELESASAQLSQTQFKHYEQRVLRMAGYALNDKIILQNELFLLDRLAYFADGSCSEQDPVKLLFDVTEHLDLALLASSRSPAQLVPLKRIAWILERLNSDSNLTPIDAKAGIRHMLPEASFRWHQYLWRNGTSFWSEALREQDAVQLLAACAWQRLDEMTTLNRQSSSDLAGPTLLQYDVESRVSFSTLFALDDVPLYACDTKLQQLVNVRQTYAELPRHEDAQRSEMKRILSNLQQVHTNSTV
ncbi:P-loop containing nucleoside triphosphate hydrolase protein [Phlyctochytrium arcticum]|nr:P-loop containing nucleoside triphosphate hydrolase protein [Phlyctochytrium arcticum]